MSYFLETQALYQTLHVAFNYNDYISKKPGLISRVLKIGDFSDSLSLPQFNATNISEHYYVPGTTLTFNRYYSFNPQNGLLRYILILPPFD